MYHLITKTFVFAGLLLVLNQAVAASSSALYDVEALVVDESADIRWRVLKEGLDEVFIRISGDSIVMDKLKRPPASRYVKRYSYEPVADPVENEQGEVLGQRLKIQYNGSSMEKYLLDNGYPVWGEHRTDVVVWLAIRDGRNEYVLKDTDQSLIKTSADDALRRRGIPRRWPSYDKKDRKILKVADIRGGFKDPVSAASKRYSRGPALTGSLIWNGNKWQSSWSLLMAAGNRHWSIENADYEQLIDKAIDQAADAMGIIFAVKSNGSSQQMASLQLEVQAVDSIKKYRRLENYLRDLSAVAMVVPLKVNGQNAMFEITLRSSEEDFLNLIKNDAELIGAKPEIQDTTSVNEGTGITDVSVDITAAENSQGDGLLSSPPVAPSDEHSLEIIPQPTIYHYKLAH